MCVNALSWWLCLGILFDTALVCVVKIIKSLAAGNTNKSPHAFFTSLLFIPSAFCKVFTWSIISSTVSVNTAARVISPPAFPRRNALQSKSKGATFCLGFSTLIYSSNAVYCANGLNVLDGPTCRVVWKRKNSISSIPITVTVSQVGMLVQGKSRLYLVSFTGFALYEMEF